jgi:hypothetical protein
VPTDDERIARAARALRRKAGLTQVEAVGAGRSRHFVRRLEAGEAGSLRLGDVRDHFAQFDARARMNVWWNGAAIDRLLDERHARLINESILVLGEYGWSSRTEITYSEFGERGSLDLFAAKPVARAVLVGEVKSEWGSMEETLRMLDVKTRLAIKLAVATFGFEPDVVGRVLILPEESTARRIAAAQAATLEVALPDRNRRVRKWLRTPDGPLRGLWFLSDVHAAEHASPPDGRQTPKSGDSGAI